MKIRKSVNKIISSFLVIVMIFGIGWASKVEAASLSSVKDLLSNSRVSTVATHTIKLTTHIPLISGDYYSVDIPGTFGGILVGNITCPASSTPSSPASTTARCTATSGIPAGTSTITIANIINPSSVGSYPITISTKHTAGAIIETLNAVVAIINGVSVSASVASTLSFQVISLATSTSINGATTTAASATSTISFGTLPIGTSTIIGQGLKVSTNAMGGFTVTVEQDQDLTNTNGATIDAFKNGVPSTTALAWVSPSSTIDATSTYGHFGFTSEDSTLLGGDVFGNNLWMGFTTSTPVQVMYHTGPADASTTDKGFTKVAYRVEIGALQEAGDYSNTLTYIITPTY